jgi:outer membrane protein
MNRNSICRALILAGTCTSLLGPPLLAQQLRLSIPNTPARPDPQAAASTPARVSLTLQDALDRARKNSTQFQAAVTAAGLAREDRKQAFASLLPSVAYNNSAIYTQGTGAEALKATGQPVVFIANNAVHEYISQANIHEAIDFAAVQNFRKASAAAAVARAQQEIASRGLVVTVVQSYYAVAAAQQKLENARKTADEGDSFFKITQDLEHGGEVAHSDVIKAELQATDRKRQLQEAQLALLNARLDLAVLIFPDFNDNYETADDLHANVPLPQREEFEAQAAHENPEIREALANAQAAGHDVQTARAGYLPSITLDYWYGIDAPNYATNSIVNDHKVSNLGSSAMAALTLPVWNWGATQSRVRQAELKRELAKKELSFAQRKLLAEMRSLYSEAETALNELSGLQRSAELSAESLRLTTLRYKGGEATVLEVVDAQSTFAQANAAYQNGAVRYRVALANLQTLTGVMTTP